MMGAQRTQGRELAWEGVWVELAVRWHQPGAPRERVFGHLDLDGQRGNSSFAKCAPAQ